MPISRTDAARNGAAPRWTFAEEELLRKHTALGRPVAEIAVLLGRTERSIWARAYRNGIDLAWRRPHRRHPVQSGAPYRTTLELPVDLLLRVNRQLASKQTLAGHIRRLLREDLQRHAQQAAE